jgi:Methyltransferase FkbM domain
MAKSINSFCSEENISQIDILKVDVQGAEFDVLNGAKEMMSSGSISIIYCELIIPPIYENQRKLSEYFTLLESTDSIKLHFHKGILVEVFFDS